MLKAAFSESELLLAGAAAGSGAGQQQPGCAGVQIEKPGPLEAGGAAGSLPAPGEQGGEGELEGREAPPSRAWPGGWCPTSWAVGAGALQVLLDKSNPLKGSGGWGVFLGSGNVSEL